MIPSSITDDIDLRKDIGAGSAPLREIPKEMRDPAARTVFLKDWVQKRAAEATKFIDDFFVPPSTTVTGDLP
jgi:hypothetical protein